MRAGARTVSRDYATWAKRSWRQPRLLTDEAVMRQASTILTAAAFLVVTACGGDTTGPAKPTQGTMSARIGGSAWSAISIATDSATPSLFVLTGANGSAKLTLVIPMAAGLGTQVVGGPTPMGAGLVVGPQSWATSRTQGGSGSITLTTLAPGHVAGTFELTLAHEGAFPAEQRVTSGTFDVTY